MSKSIDTLYELDHPRNFIAGFVGADTLKAHHRLALKAGAIRFVPFATLPDKRVSASELRERWADLYDEVIAPADYETDGIVVEVDDRALRDAMGATARHERAVLAIKRLGDTAISTVRDIRLTTGRTGRIVPTLLIDTVNLSGANVSKATAHTAANLLTQGIGVGAEGRFTRAGAVIPKLVEIIRPAETPLSVTHCPSCGAEAVAEGEHMVCPESESCVAQAESRLRHWFHTLGNIDLFGRRTIATLVAAEITDLPAIYAMQAEDFEALGFGPGQSRNLVEQLARSLREPVMEWRWLAAFGIRHLGKGDARTLLAHIPLDDLAHVTPEQIESIPGFGAKTAPAIAERLSALWPIIDQMRSLGFVLARDEPADASGEGVLTGERVVFTGTMLQGKRKDMEEQARQLGAEVQSAVTAKTTLLVAGEKAGSKMKKAEQINDKAGRQVVRVLSEAEYLEDISETQDAVA